MTEPGTSLRVVVYVGDEVRRIVPLTDRDLTIGRGAENDLVIDDAYVSRRHARLEVRHGRLWIEDLGSANGTHVNGVPADRRALGPGDQIELGPFRLVVEEACGGLEAVAEVTAVGRPPPAPTSGFAGAGLRVLLSVLEGFDVEAGREVVLERLLDGLLDALDGERAFLFRYDVRRGRAERVQGRVRPPAVESMPVSESLVMRVARDRKACMVTDLLREGDPDVPSLQRLLGGRVQSIVVAPLLRARRLVGVLYVDSQAARRAFTRDDLDLLSRATAYLAGIVEAVERQAALAQENERLRAAVAADALRDPPLDLLCDPQSPMAAALALARRAASRDVTVLIIGETGTGKEVLARYIHALSERRAGRFVAINCGAIPETLVESELFGFRRGAFSGAAEDRPGLVEAAHGGTLFLDEVGELPVAAQVKLLRVLEERQVQRLGSTEPTVVDFRLVGATNRDLAADVAAGTFRRDLFYRLRVVALAVPPLRERLMDLGALVAHFIDTLAVRMGSPARAVSPEAMRALAGYDWPGNVRELRNAMERAMLLEDTEALSLASLPVEVVQAAAGPAAQARAPGDDAGSGPVKPYSEELTSFEVAYLRRLYRQVGRNISAMARVSGISRLTLQRKMKVWGRLIVGPDPGPQG